MIKNLLIFRSVPSIARNHRFFSTSLSISQKVSLTLFAKDGCSLCDKAKVVLEDVRKSESLNKKIDFQYVDITNPLNSQWWDAYCFDVPVLHVDRTHQEQPVKFMHRLNGEQIIEEINKD